MILLGNLNEVLLSVENIMYRVLDKNTEIVEINLASHI